VDPTGTLLRWGFVVLGTNLSLDDELRRELLVLAIRAYLDDLPRVDFDWETASGCVTTDGDAAVLGSFIGQRFVAEVETADRTGKVEFLVTEAQLKLAAEARDAEEALVH